jgi:hypothetical protein
MVDIWEDPSLVDGWSRAFDGAVQPGELLAGYPAAVDWPAAFYWRELMDYFRDAKVVLTVRDSEAWTASIERTIWEVLFGDGLMPHLSSARASIDPHWRRYRELMKRMWQRSGIMRNPRRGFDAVHAARAMEEHNWAVQAGVPAERLLVWRPSDGVAPLADFLGVERINWEVPYTNGEAAFFEQVTRSALAAIRESLGRTATEPGT